MFAAARSFIILLVCMLSGALTTMTLKWLFDTQVLLADGSVAKFHCPYFANLVNFLAGAMLVALEEFVQRISACTRRAGKQDDDSGFSSSDIMHYVFGQWNLGLSGFNVVVNFCSQAALLFVPASVHAVLRQGNIPLVAACRFYVFQKDCARNELIGVGLTTLGLVLMGLVARASQVTDVHLHKSTNYSFGILLVGVSITLLAGRYCVEEMMMERGKIPAMVVLGGQGIIGSIISAALLVFAHHAGYEDFGITLAMLRTSSTVQLLVAYFFMLTIVYWITQAYVTQMFGVTCRAMARGTKPLIVWLLQLMSFYMINATANAQVYGEPWVAPWSWLTLLAAILVSVGVALHSCSETPSAKTLVEERLERGQLINK
eukprot:TRINITY_DN30268_c0_g1_i1.p1 TRINITY_DN30268_c0_g1~~TRINITY_DN30268_c0_g1_i1.p1  ORF type:complete len:374 (+),score=50.16 TRINITY_DN30268_c0_g1_i1:76-1197(+)